MAVLVTGGAGYIGSHTVLELIEKNEEVIVVDNLEKGHKKAVLGGKLIVGDLRDMDFIRSVFKNNNIEAVIHFAAYIEVGESVKDPLKYYNNNVVCHLKPFNCHERSRGWIKLYFHQLQQHMVNLRISRYRKQIRHFQQTLTERRN